MLKRSLLSRRDKIALSRQDIRLDSPVYVPKSAGFTGNPAHYGTCGAASSYVLRACLCCFVLCCIALCCFVCVVSLFGCLLIVCLFV